MLRCRQGRAASTHLHAKVSRAEAAGPLKSTTGNRRASLRISGAGHFYPSRAERRDTRRPSSYGYQPAPRARAASPLQMQSTEPGTAHPTGARGQAETRRARGVGSVLAVHFLDVVAGGLAQAFEDQVRIDRVALRHLRHRNAWRGRMKADRPLLLIRPEPLRPMRHAITTVSPIDSGRYPALSPCGRAGRPDGYPRSMLFPSCNPPIS